MDKETRLFYLTKIRNKLQFKLQNLRKSDNYLMTNEIIKYIEMCIDICDLIERKYFENLKEVKNFFSLVQATVMQKDYYNAKELVEIKIKELEQSTNISSSK